MKLLFMGKGDDRFNAIHRSLREDDIASFAKSYVNFRSKLKGIGQERRTVLLAELSTRLLHLACGEHDSVKCAQILLDGKTDITAVSVNVTDFWGRTALDFAADNHSFHCIKLLLSKGATGAAKEVNGRSLCALEMSLMSSRVQGVWSLDDPIEYLLPRLEEKGMDAVSLLAVSNSDVWEVAYRYSMEGNVIAFAMLLIVAGEQISAAVTMRINGAKRMKSIYDFVVNEALLDASTESDMRRAALHCEIQLLQEFKGEFLNARNMVPMENHNAEKGSSSTSKRTMLTDYVNLKKQYFMDVTRLPDGCLALDMRTEGYQFVNGLIACFLITFASSKCWGDLFSWANFYVVNDEIRILIWARRSLPNEAIKTDLGHLADYLEKIFTSDNPDVYWKRPAYLDCFLEFLREYSLSNLLRTGSLIMKLHPFVMPSFVRLIVMIMLKRKSNGASKSEEEKWRTCKDAAFYNAGELDPQTLRNVAVFKQVIEEGERRGSTYTKLANCVFALLRDYPMHAPDHRCKDLPVNMTEMFKDDNGVELMVPRYLKNYFAELIIQLIDHDVEIVDELSHATSRCPECIKKQLEVISMLKKAAKPVGLSIEVSMLRRIR